MSRSLFPVNYEYSSKFTKGAVRGWHPRFRFGRIRPESLNSANYLPTPTLGKRAGKALLQWEPDIPGEHCAAGPQSGPGL